MPSAKQLHRQAMEATDRAGVHRRHGDAAAEKAALREALELELAAIAALPPDADRDRAILTESADEIRRRL